MNYKTPNYIINDFQFDKIIDIVIDLLKPSKLSAEAKKALIKEFTEIMCNIADSKIQEEKG